MERNDYITAITMSVIAGLIVYFLTKKWKVI